MVNLHPLLVVVYYRKFEGASPLQNLCSPSPFKERSQTRLGEGIKGMRLIDNLRKSGGNYNAQLRT